MRKSEYTMLSLVVLRSGAAGIDGRYPNRDHFIFIIPGKALYSRNGVVVLNHLQFQYGRFALKPVCDHRPARIKKASARLEKVMIVKESG